MHKRKWMMIPFLFIIVVALSSCGVKDETGIIKNLLSNDTLRPTYEDTAEMNNYMRCMSYFYNGTTGAPQPTFVFDGQDVRFEDMANYYTLSNSDDTVTFVPRQNIQNQYTDTIKSEAAGIVINDVLYNGRQDIVYSTNKEGNTVAWELDIEKDETSLVGTGNILPYADELYFTCEGSLYRCRGKDLEYAGVRDDGVYLLKVQNTEQVFNTTAIRYFGIFSDTIVMLGDDDCIWTLDIPSSKAVCVFEGNQYYDSGCCVDNGYVYYVVGNVDGRTGSLERVKFDGSDREVDLLAFNKDILMHYIFNISNGDLYFLQYSKLHDGYFLCKAPLTDLTNQTTLAFCADHGIDDWISELYPHGEWVYYASTNTGFWRAKTDGTLVEKIQEFNNENVSENMNSLTIDVTEKVSDFVFEQYELLSGSNPNMVGGYCGAELEGKNASWKLEDGILTISGLGDMLDLNSYDDQPWANVRFDATSIIVEEGITSIGNECFRNLSNVTNVSLPTSLVRIGKDAFLYTSLEQINLPDNLENIGEGAFSNLTSLTGKLFLPNSITEIGKTAFYGCSGLTGTLKLPASLRSIGEMAFKDCSGFTGSLTIPGGVETIEAGAFAHCSQLDGTLTLAEGVRIVEQNAFYGCSKIESLDLPFSLEEVQSTAFNKCGSVNTIIYHGSRYFAGYRYLPKATAIDAD